MVRQQLYAAVRETLALPYSMFRDNGSSIMVWLGDIDKYVDPQAHMQEKDNADWYRLSQFYVSIFQYPDFQSNRAGNDGWGQYIEFAGWSTPSPYDITKDPTRELIHALFAASGNPQGSTFQHASHELEQLVRSLLLPIRSRQYEVVTKIMKYVISQHEYGKQKGTVESERFRQWTQNSMRVHAERFPIVDRDRNGQYWVNSNKCQSLVRQEVDALIRQQKQMVEQFIIDLYKVLRLLADDPIVSGSGTYEEKPIELSSAEIAGRIADTLANPDVAYSARCKIGMEEHIIQARPFGEAESDTVWMARRERIIAHTRQEYCKLRDDIDTEVFERHEELTKRQAPTARTTSDDDE
jgi:hypothetical protein